MQEYWQAAHISHEPGNGSLWLKGLKAQTVQIKTNQPGLLFHFCVKSLLQLLRDNYLYVLLSTACIKDFNRTIKMHIPAPFLRFNAKLLALTLILCHDQFCYSDLLIPFESDCSLQYSEVLPIKKSRLET